MLTPKFNPNHINSNQYAGISNNHIYTERSLLTSTLSTITMLIILGTAIGRFAKGFTYHKLSKFVESIMHTMFYCAELISRIALVGCVLNTILFVSIRSSKENMYYYSKIFRDLGIFSDVEIRDTANFDLPNSEIRCIITILIIQTLFSIAMFYISPKRYDVKWFRYITAGFPVIYYFMLVCNKYITGADYFIPIIGTAGVINTLFGLILSVLVSFYTDSLFSNLRMHVKSVNSGSSSRNNGGGIVSELVDMFRDFYKAFSAFLIFLVVKVSNYLYGLPNEINLMIHRILNSETCKLVKEVIYVMVDDILEKIATWEKSLPNYERPNKKPVPPEVIFSRFNIKPRKRSEYIHC